MHLDLGDPEDEGAAVRHVGHEPFVHELPQRLAHGGPARPELGGDPRLDEPVARPDAADADRLPHDLRHVLGAVRARAPTGAEVRLGG